MSGGTTRRVLTRAAVVALGAVVGMVLLSGTGQPVTAQTHASWQPIAGPPLSVRNDALGVLVGHRVLVLGGRGAEGVPLPDGASYDVHTGRWHHLRTPIALTAADNAVAAAGVAVVRHAGPRSTTWWAFDPTPGIWTRLRGVPAGAGAPTAFGSEVYAIAGQHVVVFSVALDRWTPLPVDRHRPSLTGRRVAASRAGIVVTGHAPGSAAVVEDRWDGLTWHRHRGGTAPHPERRPLPAGVAASGATRVRADGQWLVVSSARAWIRIS